MTRFRTFFRRILIVTLAVSYCMMATGFLSPALWISDPSGKESQVSCSMKKADNSHNCICTMGKTEKKGCCCKHDPGLLTRPEESRADELDVGPMLRECGSHKEVALAPDSKLKPHGYFHPSFRGILPETFSIPSPHAPVPHNPFPDPIEKIPILRFSMPA